MTEDPSNKSQQIELPKEEPFQIPSRAEQKRRARRIWMLCIFFSLFVLVSMGGTILILIVQRQDIQRVVAFSTVTFQVIIGMFATGFTTPLFLEQRLNFLIGLEMSRRSVDVLDKVDDNIGQRLKRVDLLLDSAEQMKEGKGALIQVFREEMAKLRKEIRASKTETENELSAALDEGERAANAPDCPRCGEKMIFTKGNGETTDGYVCTCVPVDLADIEKPK